MNNFLYVADIAKILNITETAVRGRVQRKSPSIPKWRVWENRLVWTKEDVQKWQEQRYSLLGEA